ncbi:class I SAM-dependent methyltransferase [Streptomonospora sp. S1-112]|uniref:Class I SAM-dependent methyltransferase n=1 Tax=Streptomonospora mangrovi TaxID=2883123 RepID=A0A9X3NT88_9ACTN|nr:class I SAM-dependent methyltransferase [Streptomonospora mangrovi]MDA0567948.1 class I SAM-dependent methyltransferase [Streptomonospora mangrovi]
MTDAARERAQSFDHVAAEYERLAELTGDDGVGAWLPGVLPDASAASGGRALDLGCGTGRHTLVLAERFAHVEAVDLSRPMLDIARAKRSRLNVVYRCGDLLAEDGGPTGRYDFVLSVRTLHHVADLEAALRRIRRLVAPGGRAVLIDVVSRRPSVPRWWLRGGLLRKLLRNTLRRGPAEAWEVYRLSSGAWLDHRVSDRYLSRAEFERRYGSVFPEGAFTSAAGACALVWDAPSADQGDLRGAG